MTTDRIVPLFVVYSQSCSISILEKQFYRSLASFLRLIILSLFFVGPYKFVRYMYFYC